jgi:soluble lytic murein transglycosylase-like protein
MAFKAELPLRAAAPVGLLLEAAPINTTYDDLIHAVASAYGAEAGIAVLDFYALLKAVAAAESAFSPKAFRAEPQINDASRGLMQLLAGTARALGYDGTLGADSTRTGGLYTPSVSLALGAKLLTQNLRRARAPKHIIALSAYNAGFSSVAGRTDDAKRNADGTIVNQQYIDKILLFSKDYLEAARIFPTKAGRSLIDLLAEGVLLP